MAGAARLHGGQAPSREQAVQESAASRVSCLPRSRLARGRWTPCASKRRASTKCWCWLHRLGAAACLHVRLVCSFAALAPHPAAFSCRLATCRGLRSLFAFVWVQAEIEALKEALDSAQHELQHVRRRQLGASASSAALGAQAAAASVQAADGGEHVALRLQYSADGDGLPVAVALEMLPAAPSAASGPEGAEQQGLPAALAALAAAAGSSSGAGGVDPQLLQAAAAELAQLARVQGVALPGLSPAASLGRGRSDAAAAAAAAGGGDADALQAQCNALQVQVSRLQAELEQAQHEVAFARDAAERKQQELRSRFAEAQQRQGEVLRVAQDSRLDAGVGWAGCGWEPALLGVVLRCRKPCGGHPGPVACAACCVAQHLLPAAHGLPAGPHPAASHRRRVALRGCRAQGAGGGRARCAAGGGGAGPAGGWAWGVCTCPAASAWLECVRFVVLGFCRYAQACGIAVTSATPPCSGRPQADLKRAQQEAKRLHEAAAAAEARAAAADAAVQRARGAAGSEAKSSELAAQQRARIAELEAAGQQQQRALAAARQQAEALESRLAAAELTAARAAAEVRSAGWAGTAA